MKLIWIKGWEESVVAGVESLVRTLNNQDAVLGDSSTTAQIFVTDPL